MDKRKDQLFDEDQSLVQDILEKLDTIIEAKWDSDTLKVEIESLMKQRDKIFHELHTIWDEEKYSLKYTIIGNNPSKSDTMTLEKFRELLSNELGSSCLKCGTFSLCLLTKDNTPPKVNNTLQDHLKFMKRYIENPTLIKKELLTHCCNCDGEHAPH